MWRGLDDAAELYGAVIGIFFEILIQKGAARKVAFFLYGYCRRLICYFSDISVFVL